jgi:hypothetical protein
MGPPSRTSTTVKVGEYHSSLLVPKVEASPSDHGVDHTHHLPVHSLNGPYPHDPSGLSQVGGLRNCHADEDRGKTSGAQESSRLQPARCLLPSRGSAVSQTERYDLPVSRGWAVGVAICAALLCACGATGSSTATTPAPSSTSNNSQKVILKIGDACLPAIQWLDSHASSTIPGKEIDVAHGCTTTELSAALRSVHPEATPQEIQGMEQFTRNTLCTKYANTKICHGGT